MSAADAQARAALLAVIEGAGGVPDAEWPEYHTVQTPVGTLWVGRLRINQQRVDTSWLSTWWEAPVRAISAGVAPLAGGINPHSGKMNFYGAPAEAASWLAGALTRAGLTFAVPAEVSL